MPVSGVMTSGIPPTRVAIVGSPIAIARSTTVGSAAALAVCTKRSAAASSSVGSRWRCVNRTRSASASVAATRDSSQGRSGPSPASASTSGRSSGSASTASSSSSWPWSRRIGAVDRATTSPSATSSAARRRARSAVVGHAGVDDAVRHEQHVGLRAREAAVPLALHLGDGDRAGHEPLPGEDLGAALEPVDAVGGLVVDAVQGRDGGDPVAGRGGGAHDVGLRQVGVHDLDALFAQQLRGARDGPRIPREQVQLGHRHTRPAQRADLGGVRRDRQRDDDHVDVGLPGDPGEVDEPDLGAVGVQGGDQMSDLHRWLRSSLGRQRARSQVVTAPTLSGDVVGSS